MKANDKASRGTWVHASTNTDVTWFPYKMVCKAGDGYGSHGGETMIMAILDDSARNGGWCDYFGYEEHKFICKALLD